MYSYRMNSKSLELCKFLELSNSQLHLGKWFLSGEDSISSSVKWLWKWHHRECLGNKWCLSRHQAQSPPIGNTEYILTQLFNYSVRQLLATVSFPAPMLTCWVTLSKWVYLCAPQLSPLCLIVVSWMCSGVPAGSVSSLETPGETQGDEDWAYHLSSGPHVFSGSARLCDISFEQRFLGPYKKSVNHWWDLKAFLDLIVFRAGAHGSSFLHTDISGRPRGHTWPTALSWTAMRFLMPRVPSTAVLFLPIVPCCDQPICSICPLFRMLSLIPGSWKTHSPLLRMPPAFCLYFSHLCFWSSL